MMWRSGVWGTRSACRTTPHLRVSPLSTELAATRAEAALEVAEAEDKAPALTRPDPGPRGVFTGRTPRLDRPLTRDGQFGALCEARRGLRTVGVDTQVPAIPAVRAYSESRSERGEGSTTTCRTGAVLVGTRRRCSDAGDGDGGTGGWWCPVRGSLTGRSSAVPGGGEDPVPRWEPVVPQHPPDDPPGQRGLNCTVEMVSGLVDRHRPLLHRRSVPDGAARSPRGAQRCSRAALKMDQGLNGTNRAPPGPAGPWCSPPGARKARMPLSGARVAA